MPGEPREPVDPEMSDPPTQGLYLQEDVDMQCPFLVSGFVRSTLARSHSTLVERLAEKGREGMQ